jgi:hypothetical protein
MLTGLVLFVGVLEEQLGFLLKPRSGLLQEHAVVAVPVGPEVLGVLTPPRRGVVDVAAQLCGVLQEQLSRRAALLSKHP